MTASETRHSLLDEMPAPGDRSIRTVQFVGRDRTGAFALGLVRAMGDDALAYVSDGRSSGTWLSGSLSDAKLALSGRGKDRIEGRLSPGVVKGEGEVAGRHIEFQLETADQAAGVYRRLDRARSGTLESAWIVGNDGAVVGLTTSGDRVVLGYRLEGDDTGGEDDGIEPGEKPPEVEARIFHGLRCGFLLLKYHHAVAQCLNGNQQACGTVGNAGSRYQDQHCEDVFGPLP